MKNLVEHLRRSRNLSQTQLAKAVSVSRNTISSIETGKSNPSLKLAYKIAKFFINNTPYHRVLMLEDVFIFEEEK